MATRKTITLLPLLFAISLISLAQESPDSSDSLKGAQAEHYVVVEKSASFPGGLTKFYEYVRKNHHYPKNAKKNKIQGKVYVEFVVNKDGSIDDESVKVHKPENHSGRMSSLDDPECQAEAVRLLKECPDWNPGEQRGKPVRQKMVVPITFNL